MNSATNSYDAILLLSFGGLEGREDVIPFLENVLRGRNVPRERMLSVAEHYYQFDGVSPINKQNRALISAIEGELTARGIKCPVFFGNRNWHPLLGDTIQQMVDRGAKRVLVVVTSAFSSYSGCRQYLEDLERESASFGDAAPEFDKLRIFYNTPGFIAATQENITEALRRLDAKDTAATSIYFTAHSIPNSMAEKCNYEIQLQEACGLVMEAFPELSWRLCYQSRSGPPTQPWLEPDVNDLIADERPDNVIICPIGFVSDHMEILFDLDTEAKQKCERLGIGFQRVQSVGTHPRFVSSLVDLIELRMGMVDDTEVLGELGPGADQCPADCCPIGR